MKRNAARNVSRAGNGCILLLNHPGRKIKHENKIGSRITTIYLSHKKGNVCFNSVLLKIGNAREAIADINSF